MKPVREPKFPRPAQPAIPPLPIDEDWLKDFAPSLFEWQWKERAYLAVHGPHAKDADEMRRAVLDELRAGRTLQPVAIEWLTYALEGALPRAVEGRPRDPDFKTTRKLARWWISHADPSASIETNLQTATVPLAKSRSTLRDHYYKRGAKRLIEALKKHPTFLDIFDSN